MDPREHLVLYVDDERANRIVFDQTFGKKFRVKSVSGGELLAKAKEIAPDTLRIVVTAYSDLDPILHAVNQGLVVRYIVKPWDRKELEDTLRWALEAYALGRQGSALQLR